MTSVYRSGYVGTTVDPLNKKDSKAELESSDGIMHRLTVISMGEDLPVDKDIDRLYEEFSARAWQKKRFGFQAQVFKAALRVGQIHTVARWAVNHTKSPLFTELHKDFLLDTLSFVNYNKRRMSINNWRTMLEHSRRTNRGGQPAQLSAHEWNQITYFKDTDWAELMVCWLDQPNGFEDFLQTMWIMYGSGIDS